jgi:hypothetical protein
MVFNITRVTQPDSYKKISHFRIMPQKPELLAFAEKQSTKSLVSLVKNNPKSPDLLPKPIRRELSN